MGEFTHFNKEGNAVMVDVHAKDDTYRVAVAAGKIYVNKEVYAAIKGHTAKKGDVLGVARIAGIMAAKKNSELIPLCHIIALTDCEIRYEMHDEEHSIEAFCKTSCIGKTGVEMEAMTGVSVTLLTIYDMCKAMDRGMRITDIHLMEKDGGKSGHYVCEESCSVSKLCQRFLKDNIYNVVLEQVERKTCYGQKIYSRNYNSKR